MYVKPLLKYNTPRYPLREQTQNEPLLLLNIPDRWKRIACICTAVSAMTLTSLTSCGFGVVTAGELPAPTVLLTEEEAIRIINDEAAKNGFTFSKEPKKTVEIYAPKNVKDSEGIFHTEKEQITYELDGYNEDKNIAFEFISEEDRIFGDNWYQPGDLSNTLNDQFEEIKDQIIVKAFYSDNFDSKEKAEKDLREQVAGFIAWLKAEGII